MAAVLALAALGGCGGSETLKPAPLVDFKPSAKISTGWRTSVGDAKPYLFTPAEREGSIFAASHDGVLYRFDGAKGKQVWKVDTGYKLSGGVGVDGDLVMVGSEKGIVLVYGKDDGKLRWSAQVTSEILMAPRAADGIVVVRTGDGRITGLDASNGQRKWEHQFNQPPLLLRSNSGVTLYKGLVIAGIPGGRLLALNLSNGAPVWETVLAPPKGANEIERITDIAEAPVIVDGDKACAVAYQGRIGCVELARGTLTWGRDVSSAGQLGLDPITLYATDTRGAVIAYEKDSGSTLWKQERLLNRGVTGPGALPGDRNHDYVIVGDFQGYVHVLDGDTGQFAARISTDGSPVMGAPLRFGKGVVLQTQDGSLYAITVAPLGVPK